MKKNFLLNNYRFTDFIDLIVIYYLKYFGEIEQTNHMEFEIECIKKK